MKYLPRECFYSSLLQPSKEPYTIWQKGMIIAVDDESETYTIKYWSPWLEGGPGYITKTVKQSEVKIVEL